MKAVVATLNPLLLHIKYLLFVAVLLAVALIGAQMLFSGFDAMTLLRGNVVSTFVPFFGAALISMYVVKHTRKTKE